MKYFLKYKKVFTYYKTCLKKNNLNAIDQKPNNYNYKSLNKALTVEPEIMILFKGTPSEIYVKY